MMRKLLWLWNRWRWRHTDSWRVLYDDGAVSFPLYRDDARSRAAIFGGRVEWCRDWRGEMLPVQRAHDTESLNCWCGPTFLLPCDECDGGGCWKCLRGTIQLTREEAEGATVPLVIVHRYELPAVKPEKPVASRPARERTP